MTMKLIQTVTVGVGGVASIDFTSIPQLADDLIITASWRGNGSNIRLSFNGTTTTYAGVGLRGTGTGTAGFSSTYAITNAIQPTTYTANSFTNGQFYIPRYTYPIIKMYSYDNVWTNNATASILQMHSMNWNGTGAVTSISFSSVPTNLILEGSTVSLYTITAGSDGIVT